MFWHNLAMTHQPLTVDERFDRLEAQLENLATTVAKGFDSVQERFESTQEVIDELRESTHKDISRLQESTRGGIDELRDSTHKDIDEVLGVLDVMMTRIDDRFAKNEGSVTELQKTVGTIQNQLDSIEKQPEIFEDERLVMAHQLTQLHDWVERAAKRIDVEFAH